MSNTHALAREAHLTRVALLKYCIATDALISALTHL